MPVANCALLRLRTPLAGHADDSHQPAQQAQKDDHRGGKLFRHDGECTAHRTDGARARVQRIDKRAGQNAKHQAGQHLFRNEGQANGNDRRQDAKKSYLYRFHENDSLLTIPGAAAPWFVRRYHTTPHPEWEGEIAKCPRMAGIFVTVHKFCCIKSY